MKTDLKRKLDGVKTWCGEHKSEIIKGTAVVVLGCVVGRKLRSKKTSKITNAESVFKPAVDAGRDCWMNLVVQGTGEIIGQVPVTERCCMQVMDQYVKIITES